MKRRPVLTSTILVLGILLALMVSLTAFAQQGADSEETLREQAAALAAESEAAQPHSFDGVVFPSADYPLFIGVDDVTVPTYRMDPTTGMSMTAFVGAQVWGAAYDDVNDRVLFNNGSLLYEWPVGGVITTVGTIVDGGGAAQSMVSLAFYNGELYGTKNIANEAVWKIDPNTLVATVFIDYVDADLDAGGLAIHQATGEIYATNDDSTPYTQSVVRINPDASVTVIAPYPAGETDIDGLAIGGNTAYLIVDQPGVVYTLDLTTGVYGPTFPNPWTTSEVFSGGAWIAPSGPVEYCSSPALPIPDNNPVGVTDSLVLTDTLTIQDLDVYLDTSHTWVGDLVYTITHQDTGTSVVIVDRPGVPASTFGCSGNDIDATLDDEAATPVESECAASVPTIQGSFIPNNPLSAFDGESLAGTWTLNVSDNVGGDTGTLNTWCVSSGPEVSDPVISVDPASMSSTQLPNAVVTQTLTIANTGGGPLTWSIFEDATSTPAAAPIGGPVEKLGAPAGTEYSEKALALLDGPLVEVVQDGGFETGSPNAFWTESSTNFGSPLCTVATCGQGGGTGPASGTWWTWFGGIGGVYENGSVSQDVTIGNTGTATLSFWVEQAVCDGTPGDYMEVTMDGTQLWVTDATDPACGVIGYREIVLDVSAYADGGTHTLAFNSETFSGGAGPTNFFLDDVSLDDGAGVACDAPSDIPWASVSPTAGVTPGAGSSDVVVTFDSTGLADGNYTGNLCIDSNDPVTPQVVVPVDLAVLPTPNIDVTPASLSATLGVNGMEDQTLTIANTGGATLNWSVFEDNTAGPLPSAFINTTATGDPAAAVDAFDPAAAVTSVAAPLTGWEMPAAVLYDNGPLVTHPGAGAGGADESRLQNVSLGMTTLGLGHQVSAGNWVADDFTISDAGGWTLDSITYFAYQTGSSTTSTMTNVNWLLFDGQPGAGGSVIASGSGLDSTVWTNIYRVAESSPGDTSRPIMAQTLNLGSAYLPQGTYWLAWQTDGTLASGPWAPPVTITGQATTGNGLQSVDNGATWAPANDTGSGTQQGFPFIIEGTVGTPVCLAPSDIPWLSVAPASGATNAGSSSDVTVTFDAAGLSMGTYTASLCVLSDDPDEPIVAIPVTLDVIEYTIYMPIIMRMP